MWNGDPLGATATSSASSRLTATSICITRTSPRTWAPACAQQDCVRVYPLPDDPERCLEDFLELAADHARAMAEQLGRQEASVLRFLELPRLLVPWDANAYGSVVWSILTHLPWFGKEP